MFVNAIFASKPDSVHQSSAGAPLTFQTLLNVNRTLAGCGALVMVMLMVGPFQGLESMFGMTDLQAHAVAFYGLSLVAFAIAPSRRRTDLGIILLAFGLTIEVLQGMTGRSMSIIDLSADAAGIGTALVPAFIERLRFHTRTNVYGTIRDALKNDRRRQRPVRGILAPETKNTVRHHTS